MSEVQYGVIYNSGLFSNEILCLGWILYKSRVKKTPIKISYQNIFLLNRTIKSDLYLQKKRYELKIP